jgi:choline-sulfatase
VPNIWVIMTDEHNAGVLGANGNTLIRTPNLDALAARGVSFDRNYCNSPLCVPSRLSFTSGKYCSRVGAWNNDCWIADDNVASLPRLLNAAGYQSYLCGKMHYDATRRYGFTEIGGDHNHNFMNGTSKVDKRRPADDLNPLPGGLSRRFADHHTGDNGPIERHDEEVTAGTLEFLRRRRRADAPFFLLSGYLAPHFPLIVPEEYHAHYKGQIPLPVIPPGHLESQALNYKHERVAFQEVDVPADVVTAGRELYYALTEWVDNEIGKVLKGLADSEVADNTIIIYTSDHGENIGEHGLWWKYCMYEHAARIPLIISFPPSWPGRQRRALVTSSLDVVQTILELAGVPAPADWNGASLLGWLDDPAAKWKDQAVSEYYAYNITSGFAMFRTGRHKYVYHTAPDAAHAPFRELYDLDNDPTEIDNLALKPGHEDLLAHYHEALVKEVGEEPEVTEKRCRQDVEKGYGRTRPDDWRRGGL